MSSKRIYKGQCRVCNEFKKLTFEHIPPKCAFNDKAAKIFTGDSYLKCNKDLFVDNYDGLKYKPSQRGFGGYTLCETCNNITVGNYMVGSIKNGMIQY